MVNPNQIGSQWEIALLNKLTSNGERVVLVEDRVKRASQSIDELKKDLKTQTAGIDLIKSDITTIKKDLSGQNERLENIESLLVAIKKFLKIAIWLAGVIGTIFLSLIANFIFQAIS